MKKQIKTVGMYGGKFYPIHLGHVYAMIVASTLVDELHIIISYDDEYEKNILSNGSRLPHIDYQLRMRWWKEITKDLPYVHVHAVYEKNDGMFESWKLGSAGIKKVVGKPITHVFSSESAYGAIFEKLYPEANHMVIDENRKKYPISATQLRNEGVYKHWDMLPDVVRRNYVKKVAIVGTESCGKSTLVKNLATLYNTNFVEEHGRSFYEELGSYDTFEEDYLKIAYRHKYFEERALYNTNKVVFIDTEATVTHMFLKEYHNISNETLRMISKEQKYDLWLLLEPDVEWVDDGTRAFGKYEQRLSGNDLIKRMLDENGVDYTSIKGNYHDRLTVSMKLIDSIIK
ncbi:multifunctional transcriptional regulator/nicotinamide-nucleotide adenylyltransferase/ribosylnicotinamide kinase NadR [Hazenella coriacea]|uniref:HTH-type transcriptional repressor of NAD biosynthesis genes n=1 Tax=Hazenella coriacea TaxID=1179467 RepID=A0A4R3L636_9BACL|nr:multifunctional transcriptional regulator/nicotinamide-nucleotide adenylyltransferase/ribosylnicotinamide kinase NadR [Hazenella coriacea]TCS94872.1 HTH-type transcriptional repressor of NAD biosynthesis genes [Hazenella coriacea]